MITSLLADELFMILLGITTMILGVGSTVLSILGVHTLTNRIRTILTWIGSVSILLFTAVLVFNVTHFK